MARKTRLTTWYDDQRTIRGHWANTDYDLAAALDNGELRHNDGLPEWLVYDSANNTIGDIDRPGVVIWLNDDYSEVN